MYLQGQQCEDEEEIGSLVWGDVHLSSAEAISGLFGAALPTTVSNLLFVEPVNNAFCHSLFQWQCSANNFLGYL